MAFSDPSSIPNSRDQKWVDQISKILNQQLAIESETPSVCIFQVPENIATQKPEAYEPQEVGLGPNHHFRSRLYNKMEQKKLVVVQRVLQALEIKDFELVVLEKVRKLVPVIRPCYDMFLQEDDEALAWIFAIDGLFLLALFHSYNNGVDYEKEGGQLPQIKGSYEHTIYLEKTQDSDDSSPSNGRQTEAVMIEEHQIHWPPIVASNPLISEVDPERNSLGQDMMMTEAEIVTIPEREIHRAPTIASNPPIPRKRLEVDPKRRLLAQDILMVENQIPLMVLNEIRKALQQSSGNSFLSGDNVSSSILRSFSEIHSPLELCLPLKAPTHVDHLLHYMYHSIVNNVPAVKKIRLLDMENKAETTRIGGIPNFVGQAVDFANKIPRDKIVELYEQTVKTLENFSTSKTAIPSASKLHDIAQVMFHVLSKDVGIQKIMFVGKVFYLPCVTLNNDSEVTLRNLVAYETLMAKSDKFPLTEYMGLMCGLIVNAKDVKILREENIIKGDLGDEEVAKLFTGMSSSIPSMKTKEKSELQRSIERVNKVYESRPRVKMNLLLKKLAHWLLVVLRAIGGFMGASWKIVAFIVSIVTVFLLTMQAYCDVYGCDKTKITLFPYATS